MLNDYASNYTRILGFISIFFPPAKCRIDKEMIIYDSDKLVLITDDYGLYSILQQLRLKI
jgi:hypothetical protein